MFRRGTKTQFFSTNHSDRGALQALHSVHTPCFNIPETWLDVLEIMESDLYTFCSRAEDWTPYWTFRRHLESVIANTMVASSSSNAPHPQRAPPHPPITQPSQEDITLEVFPGSYRADKGTGTTVSRALDVLHATPRMLRLPLKPERY